MLLSDAADVARVAAEIAKSTLAAIDLEFLSSDRLVPALCLLQVSWIDTAADVEAPQLALLDPLAGDLRPVVRALAAHPCVVLHAGRQDLQILKTRYDAELPGLVDTQVMAAFAGVGEQVGLATLASALIGVAIAKEQQWTDWSRRPLSGAQIAYAQSDVRYLPRMYSLLAARLGERLAWAREESQVVASDALAAAAVTPESAWELVGGTRGMDAAALGALRGVAAWRQRVAMETDQPLGHVLHEKQLVELARHRPRSDEAVRSVKGMTTIARSRATEIVTAIRDGVALGPAHAGLGDASRRLWQPASPRAQRWAELLLAVTQIVADRTGVAARLMATRSDAESFARLFDEQGPKAVTAHRAMQTWRREILGTAWVAFLTGALAIVGDAASASGLDLCPGPHAHHTA